MIKYIFYTIIIVLILSYLGFDLKAFMSSDQTQSNLHYLWELLLKVWDSVLKPVYDFLADWFGPYIHQTLDSLQNHKPLPMPNADNVVPNLK